MRGHPQVTAALVVLIALTGCAAPPVAPTPTPTPSDPMSQAILLVTDCAENVLAYQVAPEEGTVTFPLEMTMVAGPYCVSINGGASTPGTIELGSTEGWISGDTIEVTATVDGGELAGKLVAVHVSPIPAPLPTSG